VKRLPPLHPGGLLGKLRPAHWQGLVVLALRLARFFGNSVEFWLNRHTSYDIETARRKID
jgi:hypothetical protein